MATKIAYRLELTHAEASDIHFVGYRYGWSDVASKHIVTDDDGSSALEFEEHEAWEWSEAIEEDMQGGHSPFPMLGGELRSKLLDLWMGIV